MKIFFKEYDFVQHKKIHGSPNVQKSAAMEKKHNILHKKIFGYGRKDSRQANAVDDISVIYR